MERPRIYTPDILVSENTVIVTTNHLGASMETPGGGPYGDSGIDAQHLANISGQRVIGLDRPHTGNGQRFSSVQSHMMCVQPEAIASSWVSKIQPAVKETGANKVELVGRSAGANLLLEVALLELLPVSGITTVDPVAIRKMSLIKGKLRYAKYQLNAKKAVTAQQEEDPRILEDIILSAADIENPLTRSLRMVRRQILDIRQNQHYWATDKGFLACALIAARQKQTKVLFAFADSPLSSDRADLEPSIASLNALRSKRPGIAPLLADFVPETTHSSFDEPRRYTAQYLRYRALGQSVSVSMQQIETISSDLL